jgi:hypothetical protein
VTLTQRNEAFASSRFSADLKIIPSTARACFRVSPGRESAEAGRSLVHRL